MGRERMRCKKGLFCLFHRAHWYVVLVCRPGSFDPSKIKNVPKKPRSKRRKATKPRKRTGKLPLKNPVFDSFGSDPDEGRNVDVVGGLNLDPLHVGVYGSDDGNEGNEGGPMEVRSEIPGEKIAAALEKTDAFQLQVSDSVERIVADDPLPGV